MVQARMLARRVVIVECIGNDVRSGSSRMVKWPEENVVRGAENEKRCDQED